MISGKFGFAFLLVGTGLVLANGPVRAAVRSVNTIALSGQTASDVAGSPTFSTFSTPQLDRGGWRVGFLSQLQIDNLSVTTSNDIGVFDAVITATSRNYRQLIRENDLVEDIFHPELGQGRVGTIDTWNYNEVAATTVTLKNEAANVDRAVLWNTRWLAREGYATPDASWSDPSPPRFGNDFERVRLGMFPSAYAYKATLAHGPGVDDSNDEGAWVWESSQTAREGQSVAGSAGRLLDSIGTPKFAAQSSRVRTIGVLRPNSLSSTYDQVLLNGNHALNQVGDVVDLSRPTGPLVIAEFTSDLSVDSWEQTVYRSRLDDYFHDPEFKRINDTNNEAILLQSFSSSSLPVIVAQEGALAPSGGGARFASFGAPLKNFGETLFYATLSGTDADHDSAIYADVSDNSFPQLLQIAREGESAPDVSGALFDEFDANLASFGTTSAAVAPGFLLFKGVLLHEEGITDLNDTGLWLTTFSFNVPTTKLLVREGNQLEVAPGDRRTVASLDVLLGSNGVDGGGNAIDYTGVTYRAFFTDGSEGIFFANGAVVVPEPGTLISLAIGVVGLGGSLRRRRL